MATEPLCRVIARKNVRSEIASRDDKIGCLLNEGPPVGLQEDLARHPIRNGLLGDTWMPDLPHTSCQSSLRAASNGDGALQRGNVTFLHGHPKYTNPFVSATTPLVLHPDKEVCTVLDMATSKSAALRRPIKPPKPRKEKRQAVPGRDGKTLGERVREAMAWKSGRLGREYKPVDLLQDVNRIAQSAPDSPFLTQQMLSAILRNQVTQTSKTPLIAVACEVSQVWLSAGAGRMIDPAS